MERIIVIGGDAAGMSAAHQALRTARSTGREIQVVALEAGDHTSYSACGIPYWVAGEVATADDLVARSPEQHRSMGVDLRTGALATGVDLVDRTVTYDDPGGERTLPFDHLVIATGGRAIVPRWAEGADGAPYIGVGPVKNLDDGAAWIGRLATPGRVVIAGGGYLGVEMAEAALSRKFEVTLVTRSRVMSSLDPDMSARIRDALTAAGVNVVENAEVARLSVDPGGKVRAVETVGGQRFACDLVVLALGIEPVTDFVDGLPLGTSGGLLTDARGSVAPRVWAAGDCCEVTHRLTGASTYLPLGTHANKTGRVVGTNLGGGTMRFEGVLGTAITRFAHSGRTLEIARTGLGSAQAAAAGIEAVSLVTEGTTASGYMPEAEPIAIKVLAEPGSRRLLGAQIVGGPGSGKRIDSVASALWGAMSVDDLAWMDLSYAPPFATAWEIVQVAARRLAERLP
jgi:NADPH-dependent 2,4-dienoyl-CoA reductase/sulfur reductase-like enzyme